MIYKKYRSKARREKALARVAQREVSADGIERRKSKLTGEELEFCVTPEAKRLRRIEVWLNADSMCQKCCKWLGGPGDDWHWHHKKFRSQGGDDSLSNAQALCPKCHDQKHGIQTSVRRTMRTTI